METTPQQAAEGMALVRVLAVVLERLVSVNTLIAQTNPGKITKFHALKAPGIVLAQYLERIHKYASCSTECFVLALIYIDRLIQRNNLLLTELNVHRVVITSVLLAAKFFDDAYYNNAYYAKVGGVLVSEMNDLEVEFLFRINFSLHVSPDVFHKYQAELMSHAIGAGLEQPKTDVSQLVAPQIFPQQNFHMSYPINAAAVAGAVVNQQLAQMQIATTQFPVPTSDYFFQRQFRSGGHQQPQQITPSPPHASHPRSHIAYEDFLHNDNLAVSSNITTHALSEAPAPVSAPAGVAMTHYNHLPLRHRHNSLPPVAQFPLTLPYVIAPAQNKSSAPFTGGTSIARSRSNSCCSVYAAGSNSPRIPEMEQFIVVDNSVYHIGHQYVPCHQHYKSEYTNPLSNHYQLGAHLTGDCNEYGRRQPDVVAYMHSLAFPGGAHL